MSLHQVSDARLDFLSAPEPQVDERIDAHVVVLNNYVRAHHVASYVELAQRVGKLTILLSVPMEPDREWEPQWADLDVRVQKNWMLTSKWKHSSGFNEPNFIHLPMDTTKQLKSLDPDIIFSYEMGMRTLLSSWYRRFHASVPLVMVGNMSEHIEKERGRARRMLRWMIQKRVDYFTYNGPSCKRYFHSLRVPAENLFHLPYCIDENAVFKGEHTASPETEDDPRRFLYCGALSKRKGILQFAECLKQWCEDHPNRKVDFSIAGSGALQSEVAACITSNLSIRFLGNRDVHDLPSAYGDAEICVFPSLADEWGLVPIEALASGVPVLGSVFAQSVESAVQEGKNGWIFEPTDRACMADAIGRAMTCSTTRLVEMGRHGRDSVAHISSAATAEKFCDIIKKVLPKSKQ